MKVLDRYNLNKTLKVKTDCVCPICGSHFIKKQYSQSFCSRQCKDIFWNARRPMTKARERYLIRYYHLYDYNEHPFSSDALGQWND